MRLPARLACLGLAAALAACGTAPSGPTTPSPLPTSPATAALPSSPPSDAPTAPSSPAPTAPPSPGPGGAPDPSGAVVLDPGLLAILPPAIDGAPLEPDPLAFEEVRADPEVAASVAAIAFFVLARGDDLAAGVVARPRIVPFDEAAFRDWRDSYDEGACELAGGVAGHASATLGGRTVHVTTCEGGMRVHHVLVVERGTVVSVFSVGPGRYGERIVEAVDG